MTKTFIAPMFKGIVNVPGDEGYALLYRKDPATGNQITSESYVELVRRMGKKSPELVADVVRGMVAVCLGERQRSFGNETTLVSVEGCLHTVGQEKLRGAQIMETIWKNVPLEGMTDGLYRRIQAVSGCTIEEVRAILERKTECEVHAITDGYHLSRASEMLRREASEGENVNVSMYAPVGAMAMVSDRQHGASFVNDIVKAGAPSEEFVKKEERNERWIYRPLHFVSRIGEKVTGGKLNVEIALARAMRK